MAFTFVDLQSEVKRRAIRDQGGTNYDTATKNIINTSLFRLSRESLWRQLRRKDTFATVAKFTTGTVSATNGSNSYTGTSMNLLTNNIQVGRRITISGSQQNYIIDTITGENAFTTNLNYDGTTASGLTHEIHGQEEYNLPIQSGRIGLIWHEDYGYPYFMRYIPDLEFYKTGVTIESDATPYAYRMWGVNNVIDQPLEGSVLRVSSSSSSDTSIGITVWGTVAGYPDFETITTDGSDGTTAVSGSKSFTSVERVVKDASTVGRITLDANSANTTVAVLPVGDTMGTIQYQKIQIYPLPTRTFNFNVQYYKDPARLVNDQDIQELGQEYDEAIILLSVAKIKAENSQKEAQSWFALYKDELMSLKKVNSDKLDYTPSMKRQRQNTAANQLVAPGLLYSQLGGNYGPTGF